MIRVEIKPELLSWARERAGFDPDALAHRFPNLAAWEQGTAKPTLKQIEKFASATHTPVGFLFLQQPPVEHIPVHKELFSDPIGHVIEEKVDQILKIKRRDFEADVSQLEDEINRLVYNLYELTDDEIAIVEGRAS
jgi:transcriptional regulator with XRE-family HTH domain